MIDKVIHHGVFEASDSVLTRYRTSYCYLVKIRLYSVDWLICSFVYRYTIYRGYHYDTILGGKSSTDLAIFQLTDLIKS